MTKLGKYEIMEQLGRGGYGTVYRAQDMVLNVERALKVLHPALVADPEFVERFKREAQTAARLEHPHIVPVYDLDEVEGSVFLAMKYMPGGSLKDVLLKETSLPYQSALQIIQQIASALDFAHSQPEQLVHRDVKPGNILFEADGVARLADFGFAKALAGTSSTSLSASGVMIGTPAYMAPEIWREQGVSPATDVYSLACVFVEMLSGKVLFSGDSPAGVMTKHLMDGPQLPEVWPDEVPAGVEDVLQKALAKDPAERYASTGEFANALVEIRRPKDERRTAEEDRLAEEQARQEGEQRAAELAQLRREADSAIAVAQWGYAEQMIGEMEILGEEGQVEAARQREVLSEARHKSKAEVRQKEERSKKEIEQLEAAAEAVLSRGDLGRAKRLVAELERLGPDGQAVAKHLRETLPKSKVFPWALGLGGLVGLACLVLVVIVVVAGPIKGENSREIPMPPTEVPVAAMVSTKRPPAFECEDPLGCVTYSPDEPIRIASALVITGPNADLGLDSQYGVEIAIDEAGEVADHPVELQVEDDGCNAEGGQAAGQKIVSDPTIIGVIGTSCSNAGVPMSEIISEAGYAMVSPSNTAPSLTDPDQAWNPGYLRTSHNDNVQGAAMADYAFNTLGLKSAAAIHDGDPYTESLANSFIKSFEGLGGTIIEFTVINVGDTDIRPVLTSVAEAGPPEFLYYPVFTAECAYLTNQAKEVAGLQNTQLAAADGCISNRAAEAIGGAGEGMIFSGPDISFSGTEYEDFKVAYKDKFGTDTLSVFHAHAYDAVNMMFDCIEEIAVKEDDGTIHVGRQALRDCLYATSGYSGLTGTLSCDQYGDCANPKISVSELQNGKYVRIWP